MTTKTIRFRQMDQTVNKAPKTILKRTNAGFTLIEVIVVLAIITLVMSLGLPAISQVTSQQLNSTTRKFIGLIRTIRNDSILLNTVYRLALDFDKQVWYVEAQRKFEMLSDEPIKDKKKKAQKDEEEGSNFALSDKYGKKPVEMPGGISLEGLYKEREGLIKKGVAYIYFFPNGFNDQSILYLNKTGSTADGYSLVLQPTSGKIDLYKERITAFEKY